MVILLVEDDKKIAGFIAKGLREENYAVDIFHNGEDVKHLNLSYALHLIKKDKNDIKRTI